MTLSQNLKDGEAALEVARQLLIENNDAHECLASTSGALKAQGEAIESLITFLESLVGETTRPTEDEIADTVPGGNGGGTIPDRAAPQLSKSQIADLEAMRGVPYGMNKIEPNPAEGEDKFFAEFPQGDRKTQPESDYAPDPDPEDNEGGTQ